MLTETRNSNVVISLHPGAAANTVIAFSYLLIIVYALTLAPVAWVYASEVWSLETRAYGMSLASLANWLFNFALGLFVPPAFRNITWKIFIIFGVLCMGAALQAFVSYPETARKSLEEIEEMFRNSAIHPWQTGECVSGRGTFADGMQLLGEASWSIASWRQRSGRRLLPRSMPREQMASPMALLTLPPMVPLLMGSMRSRGMVKLRRLETGCRVR
jgi:hypothetical protein